MQHRHRGAHTELIAGQATARGFTGAGLGETLRFAGRDWTVVGVFDAANSLLSIRARSFWCSDSSAGSSAIASPLRIASTRRTSFSVALRR